MFREPSVDTKVNSKCKGRQEYLLEIQNKVHLVPVSPPHKDKRNPHLFLIHVTGGVRFQEGCTVPRKDQQKWPLLFGNLGPREL